MARLGGILSFMIDGEIMNCEGEFEYTLSGDERTTEKGPDRIHGFSAMPRTPGIKGSIYNTKELDLTKVFEAESITAQLRLGNGKTVALREGWSVSPGTVKTAKGSVEVAFEGRQCIEVS